MAAVIHQSALTIGAIHCLTSSQAVDVLLPCFAIVAFCSPRIELEQVSYALEHACYSSCVAIIAHFAEATF